MPNDENDSRKSGEPTPLVNEVKAHNAIVAGTIENLTLLNLNVKNVYTSNNVQEIVDSARPPDQRRTANLPPGNPTPPSAGRPEQLNTIEREPRGETIPSLAPIQARANAPQGDSDSTSTDLGNHNIQRRILLGVGLVLLLLMTLTTEHRAELASFFTPPGLVIKSNLRGSLKIVKIKGRNIVDKEEIHGEKEEDKDYKLKWPDNADRLFVEITGVQLGVYYNDMTCIDVTPRHQGVIDFQFKPVDNVVFPVRVFTSEQFRNKVIHKNDDNGPEYVMVNNRQQELHKKSINSYYPGWQSVGSTEKGAAENFHCYVPPSGGPCFPLEEVGGQLEKCRLRGAP